MKRVLIVIVSIAIMTLNMSVVHDPLHYQKMLLRNELILRYIILYESSNIHDQWGDSGLAYGICQWHEESFNATKKRFNLSHLKWMNKFDQIKLCSISINSGLGRMWTTYDRAVVMADKEITQIRYAKK